MNHPGAPRPGFNLKRYEQMEIGKFTNHADLVKADFVPSKAMLLLLAAYGRPALALFAGIPAWARRSIVLGIA